IGYGKVSMRQVLARLVSAEKLEAPPAPEKPTAFTDAVKRLLRVGEERITVQVEDRPGVLAAITAVLASMNADIRTAEAKTFDDHTATIDLTLRIQDLKHLEKVVKSIRGVSGVIDVERQTVAR